MIYTVGFSSKGYTESTVEDCFSYCYSKKVLALDIETTRKYNKYAREGLDPYLSNIVMIQIGDEENQFIIDHRKVRVDKLLPLLTSPTIQIVGHNLKFEYVHFFHHYGVRLVNVFDTMVTEQVLYSGYNLSNSLKDLNKRYLDIEVDKSTRLGFLSIGDRPFTNTEIKYGVDDIVYPLKIRTQQLAAAVDRELTNCLDLEFKFLLVLADIEYKGMTFDKDVWFRTYESNKAEFDFIKDELDKHVISNYAETEFVNKQLSLFDEGINCAISWTSSKQVIKFFRYLGICPQDVSKTTKKLSYTVNAKVLKAYVANTPLNENYKSLIKTYLYFKELEQACTTFGKDFFKYVHPLTKRIHSDYKQILNTGRISSRNPNLQNIPSGSGFREAFVAPAGYKIINADYSGQETVILANKSKEPNIIRLIVEGGDMHSFVTRAIDPSLEDLSDKEIKDNHKDKRQIAKVAGFAIQYGGNGHTIAKNLGIPEQEGENVYKAYFKAFPKLKEFFTRTINTSMKQGYIEIDDVTKRKFYFSDFSKLEEHKRNNEWRDYYILKGDYERACLNYVIQGTAGSVTKLASILYRQWILESGNEENIFITNLVHDEINVEAKDEVAEQAARFLEKAMVTAGDVWCKTVPLKAEAMVVDYWTH